MRDGSACGVRGPDGAGLEKLREASQTHVPQVETFLTARFDDDELSELLAYLGRLAEDGDSADCGPPE